MGARVFGRLILLDGWMFTRWLLGVPQVVVKGLKMAAKVQQDGCWGVLHDCKHAAGGC